MSEREYALTVDGADGSAKCVVTITGFGDDDEVAAYLADRVRELVTTEWPKDRVADR